MLRKIFKKGIPAIQGLVAWVGVLIMSPQAFGHIFPKTVDELDLERYLGKWYQVASTEPFFQKDCVCTTAEYNLEESGQVRVTNRCRLKTPDGPESVADGIAELAGHPAKFNVAFGGIRLPFSNYWVVDLAEDYSYAVVSTPIRNPVWVLSRTPTLAPKLKAEIYERLSNDFFYVPWIKDTLQEGCSE